jgi:hypothetical protein
MNYFLYKMKTIKKQVLASLLPFGKALVKLCIQAADRAIAGPAGGFIPK